MRLVVYAEDNFWVVDEATSEFGPEILELLSCCSGGIRGVTNDLRKGELGYSLGEKNDYLHCRCLVAVRGH